MATHSSILAWRIPWTEEPGGYSPRGRKETRLSDCTFISIIVIEAIVDFLGGSVVKNPLANARDTGLIPGSERSPGEGNGTPLQYSCLENSMDRGGWASITKSRTRLYNFHFHCFAQFHAVTLPFLLGKESKLLWFS